jgi:hypothetical protein
MKAIISSLLAAFLIGGVPAQASSSNNSALIGKWAVDTSRLPIPPEARPKSVTITFDNSKDGRWTTRVEVVDAGGAASHAEGHSALDGAPEPVTGNLEADVAAATMPVPNVLVVQMARHGVPASTRVYTVSPDGKSMIETAAFFDKDGRPVMRTNYFKRVEQ